MRPRRTGPPGSRPGARPPRSCSVRPAWASTSSVSTTRNECQPACGSSPEPVRVHETRLTLRGQYRRKRPESSSTVYLVRSHRSAIWRRWYGCHSERDFLEPADVQGVDGVSRPIPQLDLETPVLDGGSRFIEIAQHLVLDDLIVPGQIPRNLARKVLREDTTGEPTLFIR